MTCPRCREAGRAVDVEVASSVSNPRAVGQLVSFRCPECGWEGGPYAL